MPTAPPPSNASPGAAPAAPLLLIDERLAQRLDLAKAGLDAMADITRFLDENASARHAADLAAEEARAEAEDRGRRIEVLQMEVAAREARLTGFAERLREAEARVVPLAEELEDARAEAGRLLHARDEAARLAEGRKHEGALLEAQVLHLRQQLAENEREIRERDRRIAALREELERLRGFAAHLGEFLDEARRQPAVRR